MKNLLIAAAVIAAPSAALAGPYTEAELNAGFSGSSYEGATIEIHQGYAADLGDSSSWYIQAGPALVFNPDEDVTVEMSGKVGIATELTEDLATYGEVSAMTSEDLDLGVKFGLTYQW